MDYKQLSIFNKKDIKEFFRRQKQNACRTHRGKGCSYHTSEGCGIEKYKPPICISFVCSPFTKSLQKQYNIEYQHESVNRNLIMLLLGYGREIRIEMMLDKLTAATQRIIAFDEKQKYTPLLVS